MPAAPQCQAYYQGRRRSKVGVEALASVSLMQPHAFLSARSPAPRWNRGHWTVWCIASSSWELWRASGDRCCIRQTRFDLAALQRALAKIRHPSKWSALVPEAPCCCVGTFRDALRPCLSSTELAKVTTLRPPSSTYGDHGATTAWSFRRLLGQLSPTACHQ
jgi:hypothetical protein